MALILTQNLIKIRNENILVPTWGIQIVYSGPIPSLPNNMTK